MIENPSASLIRSPEPLLNLATHGHRLCMSLLTNQVLAQSTVDQA